MFKNAIYVFHWNLEYMGKSILILLQNFSWTVDVDPTVVTGASTKPLTYICILSTCGISCVCL